MPALRISGRWLHDPGNGRVVISIVTTQAEIDAWTRTHGEPAYFPPGWWDLYMDAPGVACAELTELNTDTDEYPEGPGH